LLFEEPRDLLAALGIGDRGCNELHEVGEAILGIDRQGPAAGEDDRHAPEPAVDGDRRRHRRAQAPLASRGRARTGHADVVVDPSRPPGFEDLQGRRPFVEREPPPGDQLVAVPAPATDRTKSGIGLVAAESRRVRADQPAHFLDHGFEHVGRRNAARHEGRDTPQSCLLLGTAVAGLTARDTGRQELRELLEAILDFVEERGM
jgi:hypothetical protein